MPSTGLNLTRSKTTNAVADVAYVKEDGLSRAILPSKINAIKVMIYLMRKQNSG